MNIVAGGTGYNLHGSASRVIFVQSSWVPAQNEQAEDRCHRFGQRSIVRVTHLVTEGSVDALIARSLAKKSWGAGALWGHGTAGARQ